MFNRVRVCLLLAAASLVAVNVDAARGQMLSADNPAVIATGTAAIISFSMWIYYRESNVVKEEKIERLWEHVVESVSKVRSEDFSRAVFQLKKMDIFIFELHKDLASRYDNWYTPWNWLPAMRTAYKKAVILQILCKYIDVLYYWHTTISDEAIARLGRGIYKENYSITALVQGLRYDINLIRKMMKDVYNPFCDTLCNHLQAISDIAISSNDYKKENSSIV